MSVVDTSLPSLAEDGCSVERRAFHKSDRCWIQVERSLLQGNRGEVALRDPRGGGDPVEDVRQSR